MLFSGLTVRVGEIDSSDDAVWFESACSSALDGAYIARYD